MKRNAARKNTRIPVGLHTAHFYNHSTLTPSLSELLARICARTEELPLDRFMEYAGAMDVLMESFATEWLRMQSSELDWVKLIKYLETVSRRTSENLPVASDAHRSTRHGHWRHYPDSLAEVL